MGANESEQGVIIGQPKVWFLNDPDHLKTKQNFSHFVKTIQKQANGNRDVVYSWLQTWVQLGPHIEKKKLSKSEYSKTDF